MNVSLIVFIVLAAVLVFILILSIGFFISIVVRKMKKEAGKEKVIGSAWKPHLKKIGEGKQWVRENRTETINLKTDDNLVLEGTYIKGTTNKFVIFVHGYRSSGVGTWGGQSKYFNTKYGYNSLIVDLRGHGNSGGKYIGFGILDRFDLLKWINYLLERFGNDIEIFLEGISMGGSTVLMTTGFNLPENVKGVVADCAFTSPWNVFAHVMRADFKLPKFPILYIASFISKLFAGYGFRDYSTIEALKTNKLPVLFIHGGNDNFVPTFMSQENYKACKSEKEIIIIEGADHALSYYMDSEKVMDGIEIFMERYFT